MTKELHIIAHTHWDREWYMSFERHRIRLVDLIDTLITTMEQNPDFTRFHLDGQYIILDDYLEIRPAMRERLMKLIHQDRIQIGPMYVLQDEYLTSGEANIRNLLYGLRMCRQCGAEPVMTGYFPDAFGNIAQMPQILRGFGIDSAVFGRGINAVQFDNHVTAGKVNPSEVRWRSPDGSEVMGVMFAHWYNNAMELPEDERKLKPLLDDLIRAASASAATPFLLGMNGCDHQPVQTNLPEVLQKAQQLRPDIKIVQSGFSEYLPLLKPYYERFPVYSGELNSQNTDGIGQLVNTASSHVPIKQMNHRCQDSLVCTAEPLQILSLIHGGKDFGDLLFYSWKRLMQNHPHDSICCCSDDAVIREMQTRFTKSLEVSQEISMLSAQFIAEGIACVNEYKIIVFHLSPFQTTDTINIAIDFPIEEKINGLSLTDEEGNHVPCSYRDMGTVFTYQLPENEFRKTCNVHRFQVTFPATQTGIGWSSYRVKREISNEQLCIRVLENGAETDELSFRILPDGSLTLTDRRSGEVYEKLNIYEDCGDRGELYNFCETDDLLRFTTEGSTASWTVREQTPFSVCFRICNQISLPEGLQGTKRSSEISTKTILTDVTLTAGIARLDIHTLFYNDCRNHRLRALFPAEIRSEEVLASGQFNLVSRHITPGKMWTNPSCCQRCDDFFALESGNRNLLIASIGQNEYEILRNSHNTMALTLLRCVGEIGDWGDFPTPDAQCIGRHEFRYSVVPYSKTNCAEAYRCGTSFAHPGFYALATGNHEGSLPDHYTLVCADGHYSEFSCCKKCEDRNSILLRVFNPTDNNETATVKVDSKIKRVFFTNLNEERTLEAEIRDRTVCISVPAKKIVTLELLPEITD